MLQSEFAGTRTQKGKATPRMGVTTIVNEKAPLRGLIHYFFRFAFILAIILASILRSSSKVFGFFFLPWALSFCSNSAFSFLDIPLVILASFFSSASFVYLATSSFLCRLYKSTCSFLSCSPLFLTFLLVRFLGLGVLLISSS